MSSSLYVLQTDVSSESAPVSCAAGVSDGVSAGLEGSAGLAGSDGLLAGVSSFLLSDLVGSAGFCASLGFSPLFASG